MRLTAQTRALNPGPEPALPQKSGRKIDHCSPEPCGDADPGSLSLPFSPPRAVLTQVVMEVWAGWAGAEVTPVSPTDVPSIPGAYGHSLGNALAGAWVSLKVGVGRGGQRDTDL